MAKMSNNTRSRPIAYYRDLRLREGINYTTQEQSFVMRVNDNGSSIRLLHLLSFMPLTLPGRTGFDENGELIRELFSIVPINWEASALLALIHFNQRNGSVIADLPRRLQKCDLHLTIDLLDTQINPMESTKQLYPNLGRQRNSLKGPAVGAVVGPVLSSTTKTLSVLTGIYGVPQVSPAASSSLFDEQSSVSPTLARTIPSNPIYARAAVELLKYWNVTHAACIYRKTDYGVSFLQEMVSTASELGIELSTSGYEDETGAAVKEALEKVRDFRFIAAAISGEPEKLLLPALDIGMGPEDYVWIMPQTGIITTPNFSLPRNLEQYAKALHGSMVIDITIEPSPDLIHQISSLKNNKELQDFYVNSHPEASLFDGYKWNETLPILTPFAYTAYDAVIAMGISACETPGDFFGGHEHSEQLKQTVFDGLTGRVSFDPITGARKYEGVKFGFTNILIDEEASTEETIKFQSRLSLVLDTRLSSSSAEKIYQLAPYVFPDSTTTVPPALPPVEVEMHLIGRGAHIFGWGLAAIVLLASVTLGVWTFVHRKRTVLHLTQPLFLGLICAGTALMALSVFFMGWQEPWSQLDAACTIAPWLHVLGFSTAFSALFAKTWRINRLFHAAGTMRRTTVQAVHALWPFLLTTLVNVILLTLWTVVTPSRWIRRADDKILDRFGRHLESTASCVTQGKTAWIQWMLVVFNFLMVLFANYQSYIARNIPSEFNESFYVAVSMASLLEVFLIGFPILLVLRNSPSADFVARAVVIAFSAGSILLPIYVHKFRVKNVTHADFTSSISNALRQLPPPPDQSLVSMGENDCTDSTSCDANSRVVQGRSPRQRRRVRFADDQLRVVAH